MFCLPSFLSGLLCLRRMYEGFSLTVLSIHSQLVDPVANPEAIVEFGNARFTVLTPYVCSWGLKWHCRSSVWNTPNSTLPSSTTSLPSLWSTEISLFPSTQNRSRRTSLKSTQNSSTSCMFFWISFLTLFSSYDKNVGVVTNPAALNITLKVDQKTQWYYGRTLISLFIT